MTQTFPRRLSSLTAGLTGLTCLFTLAPSQADDRLGPINITAAREAPATAPAMPETVITREEIERSQSPSLQDLLTGRAGLTVSNEGGPGKLSNVSIWGQSASRTAVFVDGIRIGLPSAGQAYLEHIPLAHIERIEIVRGPRSGQWGADAGGGVIQIFTRKGTEDGTHLSGGIGAGSRGNREADAHLGGRQGAFDYSLGLSQRETDGFDAQSDPTTDSDDDGYERDSAQLQAGYRFGEGGHVRGHFLAASAETDFDGSFQDHSEIEQRSFGLAASTGKVGFWQFRTRAGRHIDDQDNYKGVAFASRIDTQRDSLFFANDFFVGNSTTFTVGADQTYDKLSSSYDYEKTSRRNQALFAQINTTIGQQVDLQGAVRRDFNEQFGTANTGALDVAYRLAEAWTLTAGYGTSFNVPSFDFLYGFGSGNPDLDPETTHTSRIGASWANNNWSTSVTAFRSRNTDLIVSDESTGYVPYNIDKAKIRGLEGIVGWAANNWSLEATVVYLSTENEDSGDRLPKQPRWNGRLDIDRDYGAYSLGATLHGQSNSEGGQLAEDNKGFATADLRGAYRINADWRVEARIDNLFDRDYQIVQGYNQAPRGVFVSLRYGR